MIRPRVPLFASSPRFRLGRLLATRGALDAFAATKETPLTYLARHVSGDWGNLCADDRTANDCAVDDGGRILSAYVLSTGTRLWIITEADRSTTTFLLPDEY